jgi:hypothetical protein
MTGGISVRRLLPLVVALILLVPAASSAQIVNRTEIDLSSDNTGRYQIRDSEADTNNVFRFDRFCGIVELLELNQTTGKWYWRDLPLPNLTPCVNDGRPHYRFVSTGPRPAEHVFIIHSDTKATWLFDPEKIGWIQMQ